jgi:DNA polymerase-3 subunit epsilon
MLRFFSRPWHEVPSIWIDTETTGTQPGVDRAVQIGLVCFENGLPVASFSALVNPGRPIPEEATAVHGITDADVEGAPTVEEVFEQPEVKALIKDAQPGAFNASFDREFIPKTAFDYRWPWLDSLSFVRLPDRYVAGKGRHRLVACCERHGIELPKAHDAASDARAAGELFYHLMRKIGHIRGRKLEGRSLGQLLFLQGLEELHEGYRFNLWLSQQPPLEANP